LGDEIQFEFSPSSEQLGPGHRFAGQRQNPKAPSCYRKKVAHIHDLSHVTVEIKLKAA
jgi:hypothetical protein